MNKGAKKTNIFVLPFFFSVFSNYSSNVGGTHWSPQLLHWSLLQMVLHINIQNIVYLPHLLGFGRLRLWIPLHCCRFCGWKTWGPMDISIGRSAHGQWSISCGTIGMHCLPNCSMCQPRPDHRGTYNLFCLGLNLTIQLIYQAMRFLHHRVHGNVKPRNGSCSTSTMRGGGGGAPDWPDDGDDSDNGKK